MQRCLTSASKIATAVLAVGTLGISAPAWAQKSISDMDGTESKSDFAAANTESDTRVRLLSRREGREVVDLALNETTNPDEKPDCSHLVHQIFDEAGFGYPYATSYELYAGVPQFQRVQSAQPGDLIVWQGHVGLVVDPAAHSFYSSVGSGLETQQYNDDYWRRRGHPRFYRYVVGAPDDAVAQRKSAQRPPAKAAGEENTGALTANRATPKVAADQGNTVVGRSATSGAGIGSATVNTSKVTPTVSDERDQSASLFTVPEDIPIPASHPKPTTADVNEAISELANQSGNILRGNDLATLSAPVVIFDRLQVEKIEIHHDKSWANVRIDYRVELNRGEVRSQHRTEKRRWQLEHTEDGWVAVNPTDRLYVPVDTAAQIISERLYKLTRKSADKTRSQQANLARLLDAVFN